ncbi:Bromodomain-containing protein, partial [Syncephalis pseudoplumigaleata]
SVPFLTKVSRRDAPDYYQVITRPMDLGTITKKLKEFKYQSKQEFVDDLMQIYHNCFTYNTEPVSYTHVCGGNTRQYRMFIQSMDVCMHACLW